MKCVRRPPGWAVYSSKLENPIAGVSTGSIDEFSDWPVFLFQEITLTDQEKPTRPNDGATSPVPEGSTEQPDDSTEQSEEVQDMSPDGEGNGEEAEGEGGDESPISTVPEDDATPEDSEDSESSEADEIDLDESSEAVQGDENADDSDDERGVDAVQSECIDSEEEEPSPESDTPDATTDLAEEEVESSEKPIVLDEAKSVEADDDKSVPSPDAPQADDKIVDRLKKALEIRDVRLAEWEERYEQLEREQRNQQQANESLQKKYEALEQEREQINNRLLRTAADLENYRRRSQREKEELRRYGIDGVVSELIPVVDNMERALEHAEAHDTNGSLLDGVKMVYRQFVTALKKHGVEGFESVGDTFNPERHEAIQQVETTDVDTGTIMEEFQKGYFLHDRLLRPALVSVAKRVGPPPEEAEDHSPQEQPEEATAESDVPASEEAAEEGDGEYVLEEISSEADEDPQQTGDDAEPADEQSPADEPGEVALEGDDSQQNVGKQAQDGEAESVSADDGSDFEEESEQRPARDEEQGPSSETSEESTGDSDRESN